MGNDGGSIPTRTDLIKQKKIKPKQNPHQEKKLRCTLSNTNLSNHIVIDRKGKVYNKEKLFESLLNKSIPEEYKYIKSIKDVKEVKKECIFSKIAVINEGEEGKEEKEVFLKCALSDELFFGGNKFLFFFKCGCLFSKKAYFYIESNNDFTSKEKANDNNQYIKCPNCLVLNLKKDLVDVGYVDKDDQNDITKEKEKEKENENFHINKKRKRENCSW